MKTFTFNFICSNCCKKNSVTIESEGLADDILFDQTDAKDFNTPCKIYPQAVCNFEEIKNVTNDHCEVVGARGILKNIKNFKI